MRLLCLGLIGCLAMTLSNCDAAAGNTTVKPKKVIEFGWDEPDTAFMRRHITEMERTPFDGCVFHLTYAKPDGSKGTLTWECWSQRAFTEMDEDWRRQGWDTEDPTKNYYTPAEFEASVRRALEIADEYVWVYTETPRWWSAEGTPIKLPAAYEAALRRARGTGSESAARLDPRRADWQQAGG